MKLLDMEPGKIYETEECYWRRIEAGIQSKYKDGTVWGMRVFDVDEIVELRKENARLTRTLQKLSDYYELHGSWDTFKRIVATCEEEK